jgi:hypothetical protein
MRSISSSSSLVERPIRSSSVPSADDYRELADKCFISARVARTEDECMMYLTLAQTWLEEASRRDSAIPVRLPPAPDWVTRFRMKRLSVL